MVKIRLARFGKKNRPFHRIVVIDSRKPRDGAFIEHIGFYDAIKKVETRKEKIEINLERYNYWVSQGAQPSDTVQSLVKCFN